LLQNTEIPTVREDFGTRLQALAAYIEAPQTFEEPLFHDDEVAIVNTLLAGDADSDGLAQLRGLARARSESRAAAWTEEDVAKILDQVTDEQIANAPVTILGL